MTAPTNKVDGAMMTDEQIDALVPQYFGADRFNFGPSRYREFARALLSASKPAAHQEPVAHLSTDPKQWGGSRIKPQGTFTIPVYLHPAAPAKSGEPVIPPFVTEQHTADFQRLYSLLEDGEGYDIPKDRMESLADTGLIRKTRGSVYEFTQFGLAMQDALLGYAAPQPSQPVSQTLSDGAQYFACYLIDNCENEVIREESVQAWLGKMLASPRYHPVAAPSAVVLDDERAAKTKCTQCCGLGYYRGKWPFDWSVTCEICQGKGQVRAASPQATLQDAAVSVVQAIAATKQLSNLVEAQATATQPAQTSPYLPCPICKGVEGCDHTVPERARAAQTERALTVARETLEHVRVFLRNGIELGYIAMPTIKCDPALQVPMKVDEALSLLTAAQPASGGDHA
jgi:hypothetical protein